MRQSVVSERRRAAGPQTVVDKALAVPTMEGPQRRALEERNRDRSSSLDALERPKLSKVASCYLRRPASSGFGPGFSEARSERPGTAGNS